jgi:hypothetical protein
MRPKHQVSFVNHRWGCHSVLRIAEGIEMDDLMSVTYREARLIIEAPLYSKMKQWSCGVVKGTGVVLDDESRGLAGLEMVGDICYLRLQMARRV